MNLLFHPNQIGPAKPSDGIKGPGKAPDTSQVKGDFAGMLREALAGKNIQFSAHAQRRLSSRGIVPDENLVSRLQSAVDRAESKGSRDSLVLIDSQAFIVAVRNRTVVTAFDIGQMKDDVVTNIDSAVIS